MDMSLGNEHKEINMVQREDHTKDILQGVVAYVEQHAEDFEGFLVTEKRDQQLGVYTRSLGVYPFSDNLLARMSSSLSRIHDCLMIPSSICIQTFVCTDWEIHWNNSYFWDHRD
jgi:hypothetical protein